MKKLNGVYGFLYQHGVLHVMHGAFMVTLFFSVCLYAIATHQPQTTLHVIVAILIPPVVISIAAGIITLLCVGISALRRRRYEKNLPRFTEFEGDSLISPLK